MTLSASSRLHWWSARNDSIPIYGGKPVHSRNSAATWADQRGIVQSAIVNTPREEWIDLGDGFGRRKVTRLEQSRTNSYTKSQDFSAGAGWTLSGVTNTPNATTAPDGTLTGSKLSATGGASNNPLSIGAIVGSSMAYSIFVKPITAVSFSFGLYDSTAASKVVFGTFDAATGLFTLSGGSVVGARVSVTQYGDWYRLEMAGAITSGHTHSIYAGYTGGVSIAGDAIYVWGAQAEVGLAASAYVATSGATATRSTDSFYWDFPPLPQAVMIYGRYRDQGTILADDAQVLAVSDAAGAAPLLRLWHPAGTSIIRLTHANGAGAVNSSQAAGNAYGDTVEFNAIVFPDGSIELDTSINGAAVIAAGQSGALTLAAAWSAPRLWLNGNPLAPGLAAHAEVKIVKYADVVSVTAQGRMQELRDFDFGGNGTQL